MVFLLVLHPVHLSVSAQPNLVYNGDFELNNGSLVGWATPQGTTESNPVNGLSVTLVAFCSQIGSAGAGPSGFAYSGLCSAAFGAFAFNQSLTQAVPIIGGHQYILSLFLMIQDGDPSAFFELSYQHNTEAESIPLTDSSTAGGGPTYWTQLSFTINSPAGATSVNLTLSGSDPQWGFLVDSVTLYDGGGSGTPSAVSPPPGPPPLNPNPFNNILLNGDFESGSAVPWGFPSGDADFSWQVEGRGASNFVTWSDHGYGTCPQGYWCLIMGAPAFDLPMVQAVPVSTDLNYTLSFIWSTPGGYLANSSTDLGSALLVSYTWDDGSPPTSILRQDNNTAPVASTTVTAYIGVPPTGASSLSLQLDAFSTSSFYTLDYFVLTATCTSACSTPELLITDNYANTLTDQSANYTTTSNNSSPYYILQIFLNNITATHPGQVETFFLAAITTLINSTYQAFGVNSVPTGPIIVGQFVGNASAPNNIVGVYTFVFDATVPGSVMVEYSYASTATGNTTSDQGAFLSGASLAVQIAKDRIIFAAAPKFVGNPDWRLTAYQMDSKVVQFTSTWTVPPPPKADVGQFLVLFNGLAPADNSIIVQPVLAWNSDLCPNKWCVYGEKEPGLKRTKAVPVNCGDEVTGAITFTGINIVGISNFGIPFLGGFSIKYLYTCKFVKPKTETLSVTVDKPLTAVVEVFESYLPANRGNPVYATAHRDPQAANADAYPRCDTAFKDPVLISGTLPVTDKGNTKPALKWTTETSPIIAMETIEIKAGGEVDIHFRAGQPQTTQDKCCPASSSSSSSSTGRPSSSSSPTSSKGSVTSAPAPSSTAAKAFSDPRFIGFWGQEFFAGGLADRVYNLISDEHTLINAFFIYLDHVNCTHSNGLSLPRCFSHPGTYFGVLSVVSRNGDRLRITAGGSAEGFHGVTVNDVEIEVGELFGSLTGGVNETRNSIYMKRLTSRSLIIYAGLYEVLIENIDQYVDLASVTVTSWPYMLDHVQPEGLLGRTWNVSVDGSDSDRVMEGYREKDENLMGCNFAKDKFCRHAPSSIA